MVKIVMSFFNTDVYVEFRVYIGYTQHTLQAEKGTVHVSEVGVG